MFGRIVPLRTAPARVDAAYSGRIDAGPFFDPDLYPELAPITAAWQHVRAEALAARPHQTFVADRRAAANTWGVLPFRVESEDRPVVPDELCARNRGLAPITAALVEPMACVEAYSFSSLAPGAVIAEHRHQQPFVTAALCLSGAEHASIRVGHETRPYRDGEWVVFDYTQPHEVTNRGTLARVVLLVLLEAR